MSSTNTAIRNPEDIIAGLESIVLGNASETSFMEKRLWNTPNGYIQPSDSKSTMTKIKEGPYFLADGSVLKSVTFAYKSNFVGSGRYKDEREITIAFLERQGALVPAEWKQTRAADAPNYDDRPGLEPGLGGYKLLKVIEQTDGKNL